MSERRPTIVIVTNYYVPTVGGITTYVRSLAGALKERGHEVPVMAFPAWLSKKEDGIQSKLAYRVVHELAVTVFIMIVLGKILRLRLSGKRVIVHSQSASFCLEAGILARPLGVRVVHTFHSPIERCTIKLGGLLPFADAFVCVSEEHKAQYVKACGINPDAAVIPGGVDCSFLHPIPVEEKIEAIRDLAKSTGIETLSPPIILFVGRVIREKGAEVLLKAAGRVTEEFPGAVFLVIGPLDQSRAQRAFIEDLRRRVGQGMRFYFVGALTQYELRRAYQASDIFACPVLWEEASGLVVVEAMASGLPVVASRIGGLKSRVVEGISGRLVEPGNSDELAEAILSYLKRPDMAREAGKESRALAVAKYSIDTMTNAYEDIYQRVTVR